MESKEAVDVLRGMVRAYVQEEREFRKNASVEAQKMLDSIPYRTLETAKTEDEVIEIFIAAFVLAMTCEKCINSPEQVRTVVKLLIGFAHSYKGVLQLLGRYNEKEVQ